MPPYSPDLNPIEEAFGQLKQWIRKNRVLSESFENFGDFLRLGLEAVGRSTKGHFAKCRLGRTQPRDGNDMYNDFDENLDENEYY